MKNSFLILLLIVCSVSAFAQTTRLEGGSGSHGGDGRIVLEDDDSLQKEQLDLKDLNTRLIDYLLRLKANRYRIESSKTKLFDAILSPEFLNDVQNPNYKIFLSRGDCGLTGDGFPRVASTNAIAQDSICIDDQTIRDLRLSRAHLIGILAHEHCHHVKSCNDESHDIATAVTATYHEIMRPEEEGWCQLRRSQISLTRAMVFDERPILTHETYSFTGAQLLRRGFIKGTLLGSPFMIQVTADPERSDVRVGIGFKRKTAYPKTISLEILSSAKPYLKPVHFRFHDTLNSTTLLKDESFTCVVQARK